MRPELPRCSQRISLRVGLALFLFMALSSLGADAITNIMSQIASYQYPDSATSEVLTNAGVTSPFVSYQYLEDLRTEALTSGGISSPIISYQYFEWPGDSILGLHSSPMVSYFYAWGVGNLTILMQPVTQHALAGASVTFSLGADGQEPLSYQWLFNGQDIPGAVAPSLLLGSVTAASSGGYAVVVSNPYGSVLSATAFLSVLADGASSNPPAQLICPAPASASSGQDSLVVVTHGFIPIWDAPVLPSWVTALTNDVQRRVDPNWSVEALDWASSAWGLSPESALNSGTIIGSLYGKQLTGRSWRYVHLIGHSAGAAVIQAIADNFKSAPNPPVIQMTFLDPFLGLFLENQNIYGQNANWADCYFTQDWTGGFTAGSLPRAYNVDVDWVDPNHFALPYASAQVAFSTHEYSHDFYIDSVTNSDPQWCATGYGFALSAEAGGESNQSGRSVGNAAGPKVLCGPPGTIPSPNMPLTWVDLALGDLANAFNAGVTSLANGGAILVADDPAWLAVGVPITNAVNFVQFDAGFSDTNAAEGLLTIYWNTNQIGIVDERIAPTGLQIYRFALPGTVTDGLYTLSFRLDAFDGITSSIAVTNVATGFVGIATPAALSVVVGTNGTPIVQLTGAPGYNYLLQSSPDLSDWTPTALLTNSDGTASFADPTWTNSATRFYRAIVP